MTIENISSVHDLPEEDKAVAPSRAKRKTLPSDKAGESTESFDELLRLTRLVDTLTQENTILKANLLDAARQNDRLRHELAELHATARAGLIGTARTTDERIASALEKLVALAERAAASE